MKPKPFRIFRAGKHTDSKGVETAFTREQLEASVKAYNDGEWRAPLVVGHPTGNAPAYGWVGAMRIDDNDEIWVDSTEKLNPEFAALMESGAYRNRSASWYAPDHPNNPTPGVWQLRHLGMLGAQPPALKGLGDVEFHDADGVTLEFADYGMSSIASMLRSLRDLLIGKWGVEDADKALPNYLISDVEASGRTIAAETAVAFSEPEDTSMTPEQLAALQAKAAADAARVAALETENATLKTQQAEFAERQATAAKAVALVECKAQLAPLVASGRLLPAQVDQVANFMVTLDDGEKTFDFGEAGSPKLSARALYLATLGTKPKQVEYSELSNDDGAALPANIKPTELAQQAREYQDSLASKGVHITSAQAVDAVIAGKKAA